MPLPSKESLEQLKRTDLQRLCKDHGIRANLKSDELVALLLDTAKPRQTPVQSSRKASVATRHSSRTTASRVSSVIIHDTDDEEDDEPDEYDQEQINEPDPQPPQPPTRTRKAKETQKRLGVGKPVVAGGSGPRAITKSISVSRNRRGKPSRSVKPSEATIPEEEASGSGSAEAGGYVDQEQPSVDAMASLQAELKSVQGLKAQWKDVQPQLATLGKLQERVELLTAEVKDLHAKLARAVTYKDEIRRLEARLDTFLQGQNIPRLGSPARVTSNAAFPSWPPSDPSTSQPHPGFAPALLGKRSRDSTASAMSGVVEEDQQSTIPAQDLDKHVIRPSKKRARLDDKASTKESEVQPAPTGSDSGSIHTPPRLVGSHEGITDQYVDPPPPNVPLPRMYGTSSEEAGPSRIPDPPNAPGAFNFGFPGSDAPSPGSHLFNLTTYPFSEPQSPTPANSNLLALPHDPSRTDVYQMLGLPNPQRPSGVPRMTSRASQPDASSTMYGTEMSQDSRFGDFGVEGQSNFWAGGRPLK